MKKQQNGMNGDRMAKKNTRIGHFMVAAGAIIKNSNTNKILVLKRKDTDHLKNKWEFMYGRIDQFEELEDGLKREVFEETGIKDLKINKLMRIWHIYRGEKRASNEIYGFTFICETNTNQIKLSREHCEYRWVDPEEAFELIDTIGIKKDLELYFKDSINLKIYLSDINENIKAL
ncbi:MAG: NUDIX domain-containing protein [Candidatus Woesebacteria bacterium]|jgi:8-oxo-dGTP diphosphatase